ncbi:hypothetical protein HDU76_003810, partial [Blyttiomyces sp. JEL0837]
MGTVIAENNSVNTGNTSLDIPTRKYRTNLTLAFVWDYAWTEPHEAMEVRLRDAICELAVNETNRDPTILPDTYINIMRVSSWDPDFASSDNVDSGGYTAVKAMEAVANGALLAVGEMSGQAAFCDGAAKFWKFQLLCSGFLPVQGFGPYVRQLFGYWNVKRIALVVGPDIQTKYVSKIFEQDMAVGGITILTKLQLNPSIVNAGDYSLLYRTLHHVD